MFCYYDSLFLAIYMRWFLNALSVFWLYFACFGKITLCMFMCLLKDNMLSEIIAPENKH